MGDSLSSSFDIFNLGVLVVVLPLLVAAEAGSDSVVLFMSVVDLLAVVTSKLAVDFCESVKSHYLIQI